MKAPPPGWPRISSSLFYDDAPAAIDFLCKAFGFEERYRLEMGEGVIGHCELGYEGTEAAALRPFGVGMEPLRIPIARKPNNLGFGHGVGARLDNLARIKLRIFHSF